MVDSSSGTYQVSDVQEIKGSLIRMHTSLCHLSYFQHNHKMCRVCPFDPRGCKIVQRDMQKALDRKLINITYKRKDVDEVSAIVHQFNILEPVTISYDSRRVVASPLGAHPSVSTSSNAYNVVPPAPTPAVTNIVDTSKVTRNGRIFSAVPPRKDDARKSTQEKNPVTSSAPIFEKWQPSDTSRANDE